LFAAACAAVASMSASGDEISARIPVLAPRAVAWAEKMQAQALATGAPIGSRVLSMARHVGVGNPSRVRIVVVDRVPLPDEPMLKAAALEVGLSQSSAAGMTLGYAIFVRRGYEDDVRLISHELRHVAQYEAAGGIAPFLARHLVDLAQKGYEDSAFEVDARAHEQATLPPAAS
jgi:hypothetical protein